ncbi:MAG: hypothetical protein QXR62_05010 [Candidatus Bathyarchaeia archaeon]
MRNIFVWAAVIIGAIIVPAIGGWIINNWGKNCEAIVREEFFMSMVCYIAYAIGSVFAFTAIFQGLAVPFLAAVLTAIIPPFIASKISDAAEGYEDVMRLFGAIISLLIVRAWVEPNNWGMMLYSLFSAIRHAYASLNASPPDYVVEIIIALSGIGGLVFFPVIVFLSIYSAVLFFKSIMYIRYVGTGQRGAGPALLSLILTLALIVSLGTLVDSVWDFMVSPFLGGNGDLISAFIEGMKRTMQNSIYWAEKAWRG